jgi:hypothetical protein
MTIWYTTTPCRNERRRLDYLSSPPSAFVLMNRLSLVLPVAKVTAPRELLASLIAKQS